MKQVGLVEEERLMRPRMARHALTDLPRAEAAGGQPLTLDSFAQTERLDVGRRRVWNTVSHGTSTPWP